ncbi:10095_t:CDS:2, partial [Racocetra fulgida]
LSLFSELNVANHVDSKQEQGVPQATLKKRKSLEKDQNTIEVADSPTIIVQLVVILGLIFLETTAVAYIEKREDYAGAAEPGLYKLKENVDEACSLPAPPVFCDQEKVIARPMALSVSCGLGANAEDGEAVEVPFEAGVVEFEAVEFEAVEFEFTGAGIFEFAGFGAGEL